MHGYLTELAATLMFLDDEYSVDLVVREAISVADEMLPMESREGWTEEDTKACICGSCGQVISNSDYSRDNILNLIPFTNTFNEMVTNLYGRESGVIIENAKRIRYAIIAAHAKIKEGKNE